MQLTTKQRATLRGLANSLPVVLTIGKEGIGENTLKEAAQLLEARELVKFAVGKNAPMDAAEAAQAISEIQEAAIVQVIGGKFVLFRPNPEEPKIKI